jgi:phosphoribosylglycinamide formyltransferase-1
MKTPIISFLASNRGTAAINVIGAINSWRIISEVGVVICNNKNAPIVRWCNDNAINVSIISSKTNPFDEDKTIYNKLSLVKTDLVVLSGYRKLVNNIVLRGYENRILNMHSSLLPNHSNLFGDDIYKRNQLGQVPSANVYIVTDREGCRSVLSQISVLKEGRQREAESKLYIDAINEILPKLMEVELAKIKYENWINSVI